MTENTPKKGPGRPKKDDRTPDEERHLDMLFSDIDQSFTVKVYRHDPEWCAGYLGCFHVGAGKGISIEEVKNRFGGRRIELITYDPTRGSIARKKTIMIDDVPRREGDILKRDGTTVESGEQQKQSGFSGGHPLEMLHKLNLPPHLARQAYAYYLGTPEPQQETKKSDGTGEMFQQQMMMDMMNQARQSQMTMMQQQFDMQKRMMEAMREMEDSKKPRDPMGEVNTTIKLMREINGIKSELGVGGNDSLASQVLETTVPLVETALTEYLGYKRMQAQAEVQKNMAVQDNKPPLPPRVTSAPAMPQIPESSPVSPVQQAEQMAAMYKNLPPQEQSAVMNAFIGTLEGPNTLDYQEEIDQNQNIATQLEYDTIDNAQEILTDEDRELLNGDSNHNEGGHISDRQHATPADNNNQAYRTGDPPGFPTSTD